MLSNVCFFLCFFMELGIEFELTTVINLLGSRDCIINSKLFIDIW